MTDSDVPEPTGAAGPGLFEQWHLPDQPAPYDLPPPAKKSSMPWWGWLGTGLVVMFSLIVLAGFVIKVDYFTIAPGAAVSLQDRVSVEGTETFPKDRGDIRLLFVRERNHVNLWRYLQAKLDKDIDLYPEEQLNPDNRSQTQLQDLAEQQMADAKTAASKVALEAAGYKVVQAPGLTISNVIPGFPAEDVVELGDIILSADGKKIESSDDLGKAVSKHKAGESVKLEVERDGKPRTIAVPVKVDEASGRTLIGVYASPRFELPVTVTVDTSNIGGPSAGLAMTLAILDDLTPGDLTGSNRVAVTGTMSPNGAVGEIGGISQKAVAARAAGAQLFLVPECNPENDPALLESCKADLAKATERAGRKVKVIPVATIDDALTALRENGGAPVVQVGKSDRAA
jgi:PDZ domain-containing protein